MNNFKFDLQRHGKDGGKIIGSIFAAVVFFWMGGPIWAIMGVALFSTIWMSHHQEDRGQNSIYRFDRMQETMTSDGVIPVVYGTRKISGNQTYHETNSDANTLHKHVVLCEGGIQGVSNVTAQGLLIPTGNQTSATVMTIQNTKYQDATVDLRGGNLTLYWNGQSKSVHVVSKDEYQESSDQSWWEWQISIPSLISYINRMGDGWEAFPTSTTSNFPGDMKIKENYTEVKSMSYARWVLGWLRYDDSLSDMERSWLYVTTMYWQGNFFNKLQNGNTVIVSDSLRIVPFTEEDAAAMGVSVFMPLVGRCVWIVRRTRISNHCYLNPIPFECDCVTGGTNYVFHDGDLPSNYETVGSYQNMAWLDMTFVVSAELNGNPTVETIVQGKKVYDPRVKQYVFSSNPALCLGDFLVNKRYGCGHWITADMLNIDSFVEAANYCDEIINYTDSNGSVRSARRFELNMVIDQRKSAWDWIDAMLGCFQGYITIEGTQIFLHIERESKVVYKFDDSNISELKINSDSMDDCPNRYMIKFVDPLNEWKTTCVEVNDYADQESRGKLVEKDVTLEGCTSQNQALRLGRFYRDYNYIATINASFKTGYQAMGLRCGDVVSLTYKSVFVDMPMRIVEIKESKDNQFEIAVRPYNESIYNDELGAAMHVYNYSVAKPVLGNPPAPSNLDARQDYYIDSMGVIHSSYTLTWDAANYADSLVYGVYLSRDNGKTWEFINDTTECQYVGNAIVGESYLFCIVSKAGDKKSDYSCITTTPMLITGKDEPPSQISNLMAYLRGNAIEVLWDKNVEPDIHHYEVTINSAMQTTIGTSASATAVNGVNAISVVAVDNAGNTSGASSTTVYADLAPSNIRGLVGENRGGYIILSWDSSTNAIGYTIDGSAHATVYGNTYFVPATSTGTFTYTVQAFNEYGASMASSVTVEVTDTNTLEPVLTVDLFDGITVESDCKLVSDVRFKDITDKEMKDMEKTGTEYGTYLIKL